MISPAYVRTMVAYGIEMNRRLYGAAARLDDEARRRDEGAFWGSLHGTLNHLVWGDMMWMSRFDGWEKPVKAQKDSATLYDDFATLHAARRTADSCFEEWAPRVDAAWLAGDVVWFSGSTQSERRAPRSLLVTHMFNHQTHHRGQAHALLTRHGEATGDTDLFILVPDMR